MAITEEQQAKIQRLGTSFIGKRETPVDDYLVKVWASVNSLGVPSAEKEVCIYVKMSGEPAIRIPMSCLPQLTDSLVEMQKNLSEVLA